MSYPPPPEYQPSMPPRDHPRAVPSLVLGILGLVICLICAPFAWRLGRQAVTEIDASGGQFGGRGAAQAGYVLGLIGTILLILAVGVLVVALVTGSFTVDAWSTS